jgi:hypothetical protein
LLTLSPYARAQGLEPQVDVVIELMLDGDFEEAGQALRDLEEIALGYAQPISSQLIAYLDGILAFYLDQDEGAAETKWRWSLEADPDYQWRSDLAGGDGEQLFAQLQGEGVMATRVPIIPLGYEISRSIWIDGARSTERSTVSVGWHMIQATCRDGNMRGVYSWISPDENIPCPCGYGGCFDEEPEEATEQDQLVVEVGIGGFFSDTSLLTRQSLGGSFHTVSRLVVGINVGTLWLNPTILDVAFDVEARVGLYKDVWRLRLAGGAISNTQIDMDGGDYIGTNYLLGLFGEARTAPYDDASLGVRLGLYPLEFAREPTFGTMVTALTFFANYDM